jgi:hypothetical protein
MELLRVGLSVIEGRVILNDRRLWWNRKRGDRQLKSGKEWSCVDERGEDVHWFLYKEMRYRGVGGGTHVVVKLPVRARLPHPNRSCYSPSSRTPHPHLYPHRDLSIGTFSS